MNQNLRGKGLIFLSHTEHSGIACDGLVFRISALYPPSRALLEGPFPNSGTGICDTLTFLSGDCQFPYSPLIFFKLYISEIFHHV